MSEQHAILGASSAHRWTACPMSLNYGSSGSPSNAAAAEGTVAHAIADSILRGEKPPAIDSIVREEGFAIKITEEFMRDVQAYVTYVQTRPWEGGFSPESRVNYSALLGVPYHTAWGTTDCKGIVRGEDGQRELLIIDLKFGRKAVSPRQNAQGLMYAAGVILEYALIAPLPREMRVTVAIYQPRVSYNAATWATTVGFVQDWVAMQREPALAGLAYAKGEDTVETRQRFPANPGSHCHYCSSKPACGAYHRMASQAAERPVVFNRELFAMRDAIRNGLDELEQIAYDQALTGTPFPGTKLVETRAGAAKFALPTLEIERLCREAGVDPYESKLRTASKVRDELKKKGAPAALLAALIETPPKGLKIVDADAPQQGVDMAPGGAFTGIAL